MAAGQGFKTFTTGEVLTAGDVNGYLMQGINVFTNATARDAAITAPAEGQFAFTKDNNSLWYYDGAAWVASGATGDIEGVTAGVGISGGGTSGTVTVTNSMATAIDAKGDLVPGTGADTFARLAVGTDGQVLTADSTAATGLAWATASGGSTNVAGKNGVLNSAFNVWQRGTSVAGAGGGAYTADRWFLYAGGQGTVSRQATGDTTNLAFIQYCARVQRTSGSTDTSAIPLSQSFETINSLQYAGKAVTLSFYARRGANYSPTSNALAVVLATGTGTDQNYGSAGYTGSATPISQTSTLTTTWQRFTYSATLSASLTELGVQFTMTPTGTAGAADFFEVTGVQLEIAGSASAYSPNTSTYQAELAACQRYFANVVPSTADYGTVISMFQAASSSTAKGGIRFPVPMRTSASITLANASNFTLQNSSYTPIGGSSFTYAVANTVDCRIDMSVASGLVAGNATALSGNTANLLIQASAEL